MRQALAPQHPPLAALRGPPALRRLHHSAALPHRPEGARSGRECGLGTTGRPATGPRPPAADWPAGGPTAPGGRTPAHRDTILRGQQTHQRNAT
jgi:hypothetical protein